VLQQFVEHVEASIPNDGMFPVASLFVETQKHCAEMPVDHWDSAVWFSVRVTDDLDGLRHCVAD
jgi:hypothetical protein